MGIDLFLSAAAAPWRRHTPVPHPLPPADADILRARAALVPIHIIDAVALCTANDDLDDAEAHTRTLLDDAITENLEAGIGCALVQLTRAWIVGGGEDGFYGHDLWNERITALALSGITELPLDAEPGAILPSVHRARHVAAHPDTWPHIRDHLGALLDPLGRRDHVTDRIIDTAVAAGTRQTDVLIDLLALTYRTETITKLV